MLGERLNAFFRRLRSLGAGEGLTLASILFVALAVRLWGSAFGLPHLYHPDEGFEVYRAMRLGTGGFDLDRVTHAGYYLLLFVEYVAYFVGMLFTRAVTSVDEFALAFVTDPSTAWMIGRVTTAILGTATVGLVAWQARRERGPRAGLLAGVFMAFSFRHVVNSHFVTPEVPMTFFAFASIFMVVEVTRRQASLRWWPYALITVYAALCEMPGALVLLPLAVAAWWRGGWKGEGGVFTRPTIAPILLVAVLYCVLNPGFLTHLRDVFAPAASALASEASMSETSVNLWGFYLRALLQSQGPGLLLLAALGAGFGFSRRSLSVMLHGSFLIPFYFVIVFASAANVFTPRFIVPLLPGLSLFAALGFDGLIERTRVARPWAMAVAIAGAALLVMEPARETLEWDQRMTRTDTRTQAMTWVEETLEHRTRILLEGSPEEPAQLAVPLRDTRRNVKDMIARIWKRDPGKARFWELRLETMEPPLYDLVTVPREEPWQELARYEEDGIQYAILRTDFFLPGRRDVARPLRGTAESRYAFYKELMASPRARRMASFEAGRGGDPGFDIEIWKLSGLPSEGQALRALVAGGEE